MYLDMVESNLGADARFTNMQKNTYLCPHLGTEGIRIFSTNPIVDQKAMTDSSSSHHRRRLTPVRPAGHPRKVHLRLPPSPSGAGALRTFTTNCDFGNQSDRNLMLQLIEDVGTGRSSWNF